MSQFMIRSLPDLELTANERQWCEHYASKDAPGVLYRVQEKTLMVSNFTGENNVPSVLFASSGRRTRVCALTFSGDIFFWEIRLSAQAGERMITDFAPVPALLGTSSWAGSIAQVPNPPNGNQSLAAYWHTFEPMVFDPSIVLEGTQELLLEGQTTRDPLAGADPDTARSVLHVVFHYWEFPDYPRVLGGVPGMGPNLSQKIEAARTSAQAARAKRGVPPPHPSNRVILKKGL